MKRITLQNLALVCLGALVPLCLAGCGGNKSGVSGTVSYKGKPVTGGIITLHPQAGSKATGPISVPIEASGSFTKEDVPAGSYRVAIETESIKKLLEDFQKVMKDMPKDMPSGGPGAGGAAGAGGAPGAGGAAGAAGAAGGPGPGKGPPPPMQPPPGGPGGPAGMRPPVGEYVKIPSKYSDPETSGLSVEVSEGKITGVIFQLKD